MKKIIASAVLVAVIGVPLTASAHGAAAAVALGLASFAVFNQLVLGLLAPWAYAGPYYAPYAAPYYSPGVVYAAAPAPIVRYSAPPVTYTASTAPASVVPAAYTPAPRNEVVYPHGKYVLRGDGVTTAYQWVWIPNPFPARR